MSGFVDYDNLMDTIANFLARDDLGDEIPNFIWLAECDIQRDIQFRMTDKVIEGVTTEGDEYIDLPLDYLVGQYIRWTGDNTQAEIEVSSFSAMNQLQKRPGSSSVANRMRSATVFGNRLYIGPAPAGESDYQLFYTTGVQHLGRDTQTNFILQQYPDLLLYGALLVSAPFLGADERVQTWGTFYANALEKSRVSEWDSRAGVGSLRMKPEVLVW